MFPASGGVVRHTRPAQEGCKKTTRVAFGKTGGCSVAAMPSNRSLNLCPASIREGPLANIGHLFCTVIDSPSLLQSTPCLRVCKCMRNASRAGRTSFHVVTSLLALSRTQVSFAMSHVAQDWCSKNLFKLHRRRDIRHAMEATGPAPKLVMTNTRLMIELALLERLDCKIATWF